MCYQIYEDEACFMKHVFKVLLEGLLRIGTGNRIYPNIISVLVTGTGIWFLHSGLGFDRYGHTDTDTDTDMVIPIYSKPIPIPILPSKIYIEPI